MRCVYEVCWSRFALLFAHVKAFLGGIDFRLCSSFCNTSQDFGCTG
jgi:hypothetical protein